MAQILIRDLDDSLVERLKDRARQNNRSLQGEAKALLESYAGQFTTVEALEASKQWHRRLADRGLGDSVASVREDRER